MSRPRKEIDWKTLDAILQYGAIKKDASSILGVSDDTLERRIQEEHECTFAEYREQKRAPLRVKLGQKQFEVAMNGNVTMLIWLGKQWLGQTDKQEIEQTNDVKISIDIDDLKM